MDHMKNSGRCILYDHYRKMRRAAEISVPFPKVVLINKTKAQGDYMNSTRSYKLVSSRTNDLSKLCI